MRAQLRIARLWHSPVVVWKAGLLCGRRCCIRRSGAAFVPNGPGSHRNGLLSSRETTGLGGGRRSQVAELPADMAET
jgi:hypothetical protein